MGRRTGGPEMELWLEAGYRREQLSRHHLWPLELEGRAVQLRSGALVTLPKKLVRAPENIMYLPGIWHAMAHHFWAEVVCDRVISKRQADARDGQLGMLSEEEKLEFTRKVAGCRLNLEYPGDPFFGREEIVEAVMVLDRRSAQHKRLRPSALNVDWL